MFADAQYLEQLFKRWKEDPSSIDAGWLAYFDSLISHPPQVASDSSHALEGLSKELACLFVKKLFRERGYLAAPVYCLQPDPWMEKRQMRFEEELGAYRPLLGATLDNIQAPLRAIYSSKIAFEPPADPMQAQWFFNRLESQPLQQQTIDDSIWQLLMRANYFERFLHHHFVGQKRFSLEGEEVLIPMLETLIEQFAQSAGRHVILGMTHRGRLNVLAHCLGKSYELILKEFDEQAEFSPEDMGDVKYHKGHACMRQLSGRDIFVELLANPSHLESINAVVMGFARASRHHRASSHVLPILLHGDGAFCGQGVVYETLQMSGLEGYTCQGVIHIILNNQVGFTAGPQELRSTEFCTDLAKTFGYPVFHVNAQDPEACIYCIKLALEYRLQFGRDVIIDLIGYRKWGHNESDEPRYTQPLLYEKIDACESVAYTYARSRGISDNQIQEIEEKLDLELKSALQQAKNWVHSESLRKVTSLPHDQSQTMACQLLDQMQSVETAIDERTLEILAPSTFDLPESLQVHKKVRALYEQRLELVTKRKMLDWASAELLAYGSLLYNGHSVRLSGQDSVRGTFSHRHIGIWDRAQGNYQFPLSRLENNGSKLQAFNSPISEFGVLGFEYGYSLASPDDLVIWEAQFGDFVNCAQVLVDQFLAAAHSKWGSSTRLTLFLPHGFEGQGPEHSSARMERFLSLSARGNWCLANVTSPAQLFHLLRRQILQPIRRPLVLFTPKGLLRHPKCQSSCEEILQGRFRELIYEPSQQSARALVMVSGRLYYDLKAHFTDFSHVALIRVEQLYPFAIDQWKACVEHMPDLKRVIWFQEEPINMGAASWIRQHIKPECERRDIEWRMIGREETNCIATGYPKRHAIEQDMLVQELRQQLHEVSGYCSKSSQDVCSTSHQGSMP